MANTSTPIGLAAGPASTGFHALVQASGANVPSLRVKRGGICGDVAAICFHRVPAAHVLEAKINDRRETEDDHEKLQHFGVNGRGQSAFKT